MGGSDDLTTSQLGAIRRVVKEEIEGHYAGIAKRALGWVVGAVVSIVVGAFVFGGWVSALNSRVDTAEAVFITEIKTIKDSIVEIKTDLKEEKR